MHRTAVGQDVSLDRYDGFLQRDVGADGLNGHTRDLSDSLAARDFHADNRNGPHAGCTQNLPEFAHIEWAVIEFGASDQYGPAVEKTPMKVGMSKWHAVGDQQQMSVPQVGSIGRDQA